MMMSGKEGREERRKSSRKRKKRRGGGREGGRVSNGQTPRTERSDAKNPTEKEKKRNLASPVASELSFVRQRRPGPVIDTRHTPSRRCNLPEREMHTDASYRHGPSGERAPEIFILTFFPSFFCLLASFSLLFFLALVVSLLF